MASDNKLLGQFMLVSTFRKLAVMNFESSQMLHKKLKHVPLLRE